MSGSVRPHRRQPTRLLCPWILQARTLEWVAISSSNSWKWKVKVKSLSSVRLLGTPWTAAYQAPPSMGFSRQEYWSGVPLPSPAETYIRVIGFCSEVGQEYNGATTLVTIPPEHNFSSSTNDMGMLHEDLRSQGFFQTRAEFVVLLPAFYPCGKWSELRGSANHWNGFGAGGHLQDILRIHIEKI